VSDNTEVSSLFRKGSPIVARGSSYIGRGVR
jgi:hypothetical protein